MDKATEILRENMSKLHSISKALMEKEKLTGEEFEELFNAPDMFTISEEQ